MKQTSFALTLFDFASGCEFYLKVALSCTLLHQAILWFSPTGEWPFWGQVLGYWLTGSLSFYLLGCLIEKGIKRNPAWVDRLKVRVRKVKPQSPPKFTFPGIAIGEVKNLAAAAVILALAPQTQRSGNFGADMGWFLLQVISADFCFYVAHRLLHSHPRLRKIHQKHHEFRDSSSFVAGHKSELEFVITTFTDLLPIFIFGYDITQLLAWTIISNGYNLEGHSSLSLFFIPSDFHDLHHSDYSRNYGIVQSLWDRLFQTVNPTTRKPGWAFPISAVASRLLLPAIAREAEQG